MNSTQSHRSKIDHLRERYTKRRRKQLAAATGITVVMVLLIAIISALVLSVRSCRSNDAAVTIDQFRQAQAEGTLPQKVNVLGVDKAPWLTAMGEGSLLIAGDTSLREPSYPNYPVNYIALYDYGQRSADESIPAAWSVTLDGTLTDLRIVDQCAVTSNQSLADPPVFELTGYKLANGSREWTHEIEGAQAGQLETAGRIACVSYLLPDGYRLVGYNGTSGIKVWGRKINPGSSQSDIAISTPVYLAADNGYLAYFKGSVFGLVDAETGKELRWLDFGGPVVDYAFDSDTQSIFIIIGIGPSSYIVKHLPYRDGIPLDLYAFQATDDELTGLSLVCDGNRALLAYKPATRPSGLVMVGLEAGASNPVFTAEVQHGSISDIVALPVPETEFLVAVNQHDPSRGSSGWGRLYTVGFETGNATETGLFNHQISWLASIDSGCLALLHGGRILAYLPDLGQAVEIAEMSHPELLPVINNSGEQLAVLSSPPGYRDEIPGHEMQILILD